MGSKNQEIIAEQNSISYEKLLNWGLFGKVNRELIVDKLIKNVGEPSKKEFIKFQKNWLDMMKINDEIELESWMQINGFSLNSYNLFMLRKWKFFKWKEIEFRENLESFFLEKKENYDRVSFKIIRISNKDLANELYLRIKEEEETFEEIASFYSEGYEKDNNGTVGPILISKIHPIIREILLSTKENELNRPINIDKYFVILKLVKRDIATLNEKTRNALLDELGEKYLFEKLQNNN